MIDISELTDEEVEELWRSLGCELDRRRTLKNTESQISQLSTTYLIASGLESGGEYRTPTGYMDAYPRGWVVEYAGNLWRSTRNGAVGIPGTSPDWRQIPREGEVLNWEQPHAGSEYQLGDEVVHNGHIWESLIPNNGHEPGEPHSGWLDKGPVEGEVDPEDPETPEEPEEPEEIPEWQQPTAGAEYPIGAIVIHNGHIWENTHDRNGWEPGTTHSQWTDLGPIVE